MRTSKHTVWTAARIQEDFAKAFPVVPTKTAGGLKRMLASVALAVVVVVSSATVAVVVVDSNTPEYVGTQDVYIEWGTSTATIKEAVRIVNPHATDKHVAAAVEEFIYINKASAHTLVAGTYNVPVIK